jgi:hypothetical protein
MRHLALATALLAACSSDGDHSYDFGPYDIEPAQEITRSCVQITLDNSDYLYVNSVELTTGPGFHHSNWFFVPEHIFPGEDGTFNCRDRDYSEAVAAVFGGVLFAQSTQAEHEVQQFPAGVAVPLPPHSKIVAQIHLLNGGDAKLKVKPNIKLGLIPKRDVATTLAGISFQDQALALPANRQSRFTVECDLGFRHREVFGRDPDFKIYYALAHYHELGTGLSVEAVRDTGEAKTVYTTSTQIGDTLGGPIDPPFDMTGYTKLRFWCEFYNPRPDVVKWGVGDQEMCVFLAFSDSPYNWGGGVNDEGDPENETMVGNAMHYSNPCTVFATDASH